MNIFNNIAKMPSNKKLVVPTMKIVREKIMTFLNAVVAELNVERKYQVRVEKSFLLFLEIYTKIRRLNQNKSERKIYSNICYHFQLQRRTSSVSSRSWFNQILKIFSALKVFFSRLFKRAKKVRMNFFSEHLGRGKKIMNNTRSIDIGLVEWK